MSIPEKIKTSNSSFEELKFPDMPLVDYEIKESCFICYCMLTSILEFLSYTIGGIFSDIAFCIWGVVSVVLFKKFLNRLYNQITTDIKEGRYLASCAFLFLLATFLYFIGNLSYSDINPDATQQIAAGLDALNDPARGYTGSAFLGYPARQYMLNAVPASAFGRTVTALHFGFAYLFIIAMASLFMEYRAWCAYKGVPEKYALIPCFVFPCFPFITEYYMNFEQAITPVALTMLCTSLVLRIRRKPDFSTLLGLSWVGGMLCHSYTPALATLGLLLVILVMTAMESDSYRFPIIALVLNIVLFFVPVMLFGNPEGMFAMRKPDVFSLFGMWRDFFWDKDVSFFGIFSGLVSVYMLFAALGMLKRYHFIISVWILAVVFFAEHMVGYTAYEKPWLLQRCMIIIPVLITGIFLVCITYKVMVPCTLAIYLCIMTMMSNFNLPHESFKYFQYVYPVKFVFPCIEESLEKEGMSHYDKFLIRLYTDNELWMNFSDYTEYFYPNAEVIVEPMPAQPGGDICTMTTFSVSETPFDKAKAQEFKDKRYKADVTWYISVEHPARNT